MLVGCGMFGGGCEARWSYCLVSVHLDALVNLRLQMRSFQALTGIPGLSGRLSSRGTHRALR